MKVLKIGAVWCPGCLVMRSRWEKIEKEFPWLQTEYFEFDDRQDIMQKYNVAQDVIPVFIFLDKNGNEFKRVVGEAGKEDLVAIITENKEK
jgi:thiol-disulfide isomerase/thioredoxin